jgi:mevalonate kinase
MSPMKPSTSITATAPGSLMLLGEHAVLHGHPALVCAIDRSIRVRLTPRADNRLTIHSALGQYEAPLGALADHPSFRFVLQAIRQHAKTLPDGFDLEIESEFSSDIGFGSSAAVTVATHAALARYCGCPFDREALFSAALETVHAVQGRGSGADLAAAVFGGVVGYTTKPSFDPVALSLPLTAVYCGYKTPTPKVIQRVEALRAADPQKYEQIYEEIGRSALRAVEALRAHDFDGFGAVLNRNQELMNAMGVNTPELAEIVTALQQADGVYGAKISGSGMGDCAVGIGHAELPELAYSVYHLNVSPEGVTLYE